MYKFIILLLLKTSNYCTSMVHLLDGFLIPERLKEISSINSKEHAKMSLLREENSSKDLSNSVEAITFLVKGIFFLYSDIFQTIFKNRGKIEPYLRYPCGYRGIHCLVL